MSDAASTRLTSSSTATSSSSPHGQASHDLFSYLESLPRKALLALYSDEFRGQCAAKTILQRLPEVARQYVLRLAVCGGEFPLSEVDSWSSSRGKKEAAWALKRMQALCVVEPVIDLGVKHGFHDTQVDDDDLDDAKKATSGNKSLKLTPQFQKAIHTSLTSLQSAPYPEVTPDQHALLQTAELAKKSTDSNKHFAQPPTYEQLENYTQSRWDSVLHFLVGSDNSSVEDPPAAVVHFLEKTGLMQEDPDYKKTSSSSEAPLVITSKGYEFMLQDVHVQVWQFILQYFVSLATATTTNSVEQQKETKRRAQELQKEALLFLLSLSYCRVGSGYPAASLHNKDARILMKDFSHFGLLYLCKIGGSTLFYPTRVAVNLVVGSLNDVGSTTRDTGTVSSTNNSASATRALESALSSPVPSTCHIGIIVQTNFQLCAYTTSELHVSMLGLFCDISNFRRLPNVIFYRITRDSIKSAFKLGIEARQILRFLKMHAHPRLRTGDQPLLPTNVEDQILLWDRERTRVTLTEVYVLQCLSLNEYHAVRQYALDCGAFGWSAAGKNKVMVRYEKAEIIMAFVRRWRARAAQRLTRDDSLGTEGGGVNNGGSGNSGR